MTDPYVMQYRTITIGRQQATFLRMLTNCMEEVGLTLPISMDDINILMPDTYNTAQQWGMLVSLHEKGLITFNPITERIVDVDIATVNHLFAALKARKCRPYDYYGGPAERYRTTPKAFWNSRKLKIWWTKTRVKVPVEAPHFA